MTNEPVPDQQQLINIGMSVCMEAFEIFCECGAERDFCIQHVAWTGSVFGGDNRLLWSPVNGFRPDESYCTTRFKHLFNKHYGGKEGGTQEKEKEG